MLLLAVAPANDSTDNENQWSGIEPTNIECPQTVPTETVHRECLQRVSTESVCRVGICSAQRVTVCAESACTEGVYKGC